MTAAFSVTEALDAHVLAMEEPREPDGKWHPSSLWGCGRKAVYEVRGAEATNPRSNQSHRVLRVGHILHQFVQDAVEQQNGGSIVRSWREIPTEIPSLNVTGTADGLVEFSSGFYEMQEYKSIASRSFKYADLPRVEHVGQVTPYLRGLRDHGSPAMGIAPLGDALTRARVTYVSKDDLAISEHTVLFTEAKDADLVARVTGLDPYREGTALPPRMPMETKAGKAVKNWQCGYCPFATRCWESDGDTAAAPGRELPRALTGATA